MNVRQSFRVLQGWLAALVLLSVSVPAQTAPLELSNSPLFLGVSVDPNVFFNVDDSGSMDWEILVDEHTYYLNYWEDAGVANNDDGQWLSFSSSGCGGRLAFGYYFDSPDNVAGNCSNYVDVERNSEAEVRDWRVRSSDFNVLYYNPEIDYEPWPGMSDASFTSARSNPQPGSDGHDELRDLSGFRYEVAVDDKGYQGSLPSGPDSATDGANGEVDLFDSRVSYIVDGSEITRIDLETPSAADIADLDNDCDLNDARDSVPYEDCFGTSESTSTISGSQTDQYGRTLAETKQNIANWYEYHRRRSFVTKGAIAEVINTSPKFRFGLTVINQADELFVEVPPEGTTEYSSHNDALIDSFRDYEWEALGTPLRQGLERVGRYYDDDLGRTDPIVSACQKNFSVSFSDGHWSGGPPSGIGDEDGDGHSRTLADVASFYYENDLSPLPDEVPTSVFNQNTHQHMVSFMVAFGVRGLLEDTDDDNWPNPELEEDDDWGNPDNSESEKIDDLWHAAFNSRGLFIAAQSPREVVDAISDALSNITDRAGSSASVATNTGTLSTESQVYQARFDSSDWSGQLLAFDLNLDGSVAPNAQWNAANVLDGQNYNTQRSIVTNNDNVEEGVAFRWPDDYTEPADDDLSPAQIEQLLQSAPYPADTTDPGEIAANQEYGEALVNYLRGQRSNEGSGQDFRRRNTVLGDIVNSDPRYVGEPGFHYSDAMEDKPYSDFVEANEGRAPVVYVGANDGMLHGFAEDDGSEVLGYVPSEVYGNLPELSQPDYTHRYFVDGGPNVVDAYLEGATDPQTGTSGAWRTVLAGGLSAGGQGMYALDVTNPAGFQEANAEDLVLWEFTDEDDADLGYTYSRPQIAKMADGSWAAVFGNGYNNTEADGQASATGHASLFIVDIETGQLIRKLDTETGTENTPNGLATPVLVDADNDNVVDHIYAGDLTGRLWKFDVSSDNNGQWDIAHSQGNTPQPLFTTESGQPITTQPQVARHPGGDGFMVYFGTGKYLEVGDNSATGEPTQAFYGIHDSTENDESGLDSSDLLEQSIENQFVESFDTDEDGSDDRSFTLRDVTNHEIDFSTDKGWKLDLMPENINGSANSDNFGERQVSNAIVRNGRVILTTLLPSQDPCSFGGSSFVMQLDLRNGGNLPFPTFDLNGDEVFDDQDTDAAGRMSDIGIVPTLSVLQDANQDTAVASGSSGDVEAMDLNVGTTASGRQSWRQLE